MLSCHLDPFIAFCNDLQLPSCEVHLYRGPNAFGCVLTKTMLVSEMPWWERENIYFLAGVKKGLTKRAADADVLMRGMFTLDFDIRKELEKTVMGNTAGQPLTDNDAINRAGEVILAELEKHDLWKNYRYAVMSGNGMHVHYFGEAVVVKKEEWAAGMKVLFDEVNAISPIPCDTGCGNAGRIMRMPGSWNVKGGGHKPVDVIVWQPGVTLPPLKFVQERGLHAIAQHAQAVAAERADFHDANPDGGSDVIDIINAIPIEQIVKQLLNCEISIRKKDGGARFTDTTGMERGFFKHHQHNIIVHEGTSLFPAPSGVGYNCLGLAKTVLKVDARSAIQWFAERSSVIRDAIAREKEEWAKEHAAKEVAFIDSYFTTQK